MDGSALDNGRYEIVYAVCFVLVLVGALNWLAYGCWRFTQHDEMRPIEDLFAWTEQVVGSRAAFYIQNVVYVLVGLAAVVLLILHLTVIRRRERFLVDTRQAYVYKNSVQ